METLKKVIRFHDESISRFKSLIWNHYLSQISFNIPSFPGTEAQQWKMNFNRISINFREKCFSLCCTQRLKPKWSHKLSGKEIKTAFSVYMYLFSFLIYKWFAILILMLLNGFIEIRACAEGEYIVQPARSYEFTFVCTYIIARVKGTYVVHQMHLIIVILVDPCNKTDLQALRNTPAKSNWKYYLLFYRNPII